MNQELIKRLREKESKMIEIRRYLHEHPELSFHETETPQYIADFYKEKDCDVETNVGPNGVKVTIDSGKPGKTIAIRADFDALPIEEQTGRQKIKALCMRVAMMRIQHICLFSEKH